MNLNNHNLELVRFAAKDTNRKYNVLQVGPNGTVVADGYVLFAVSALDESRAEPFLLEASTLPTDAFGSEPFDSSMLALFNPAEGRPVTPSTIIPDDYPDATINVRASLLLRAALSALLFADNKEAVVKLEVRNDVKAPIKLTCENKATGQRWLGLVMPSGERATTREFISFSKHDPLTPNAQIVAEADEFEAAIRAAEGL